jgi:hypothetical protein
MTPLLNFSDSFINIGNILIIVFGDSLETIIRVGTLFDIFISQDELMIKPVRYIM